MGLKGPPQPLPVKHTHTHTPVLRFNGFRIMQETMAFRPIIQSIWKCSSNTFNPVGDSRCGERRGVAATA